MTSSDTTSAITENLSTWMNTSTSSMSTKVPVYNDNLFLQTALCQTIAGAFTWLAILITGYHVCILNIS